MPKSEAVALAPMALPGLPSEPYPGLRRFETVQRLEERLDLAKIERLLLLMLLAPAEDRRLLGSP